MALAVLNFESDFLKGNTEICVILPDLPKQEEPEAFYGSEKKYKVMWLLHGGGGDFSDWSRKSNIELYAAENELLSSPCRGAMRCTQTGPHLPTEWITPPSFLKS